MFQRSFGIACLTSLVATTALAGQSAWESPLHLPPGGTGGVGVHLIEPSPGDLGMSLTFRRGSIPSGLGFRVGLAEDARGDLTAFGGVDASGWLTSATPDFPLDVIWFTGAGAGIGDDVLVTFPLGVSVGRTVIGDGVRFTPYLAPRLVLDAWLGRTDPPGDDLELGFALDLGMNLAFSAAWEIRFGATVGDHEALSIGLGFPAR